MDLVDDEDLVAVAHRRNRQTGDHDLADVVDTGVAGGVDLEHVDIAPLRDLDAGVAFAARIRRRPLHAVQRLGEDAGGGGLAAAARTREHEGLSDPAAGQRVAQRTRHRLLSDDIVEPLWSPFAGKNLVGHS